VDTVLITGTNRGIGLELARQYAAEGWRVLACARRMSPPLEVLSDLQRNVRVLSLDVADHAQIDRVSREVRDEPIDVLINNAGTMGKSAFGAGASEDQSFGLTDYEDWERMFRTNVAGPMKMAEAFVEHVARSRQKKIVTLTSIVGSMALNTTGGLYGYRASKAAVNAIMKSMSIDLLGRGILAVAVHPGWARTEMGGTKAPIDVGESARGVRRVIDALDRESLGHVTTYDGRVVPY
jgi:NAD(P)-dependent dehydrogenase (short-subunit alcohol dehydrogenase family)